MCIDSGHAHGVFHLFGAVWNQRGFKKPGGAAPQSNNLFDLCRQLN